MKCVRAAGLNDPGLGRDGALAMGIQAGQRSAAIDQQMRMGAAAARVGQAAMTGASWAWRAAWAGTGGSG